MNVVFDGLDCGPNSIDLRKESNRLNLALSIRKLRTAFTSHIKKTER